LSATAKGGLSRDGARALIDLKASSGAEWATNRSFDLTLDAAVEGLADATFAGSVAVPDGSAPSVNGQISLNAPDLKRLAAFAGASLPEGGPGAFQRLSLTGALSTPGANRIALDLKSLQFDDIAASGAIAANYGGTPTVSAKLTTGALDLTPYVVGQESGPSGPGWSKERIDLSALGALSGDFAIQARSVTLPQIKLGQSDISGKLNNGRLDLTIRELGLYGGGLKGDIAIDGRNNNAVAANISVGAVKILPLLKALANMDAIRGIGQMNLNVSGQGASLHDIMNSLNGQGGLKLENGALVGYNLAAMVRNVTSAFTGAGGDVQETDFSEVGGTFTIRDGVLNNADFAFLGPLIRIVGEGTVGLGAQNVNFRLTPKAVSSLKGQGGALDAKGISFPIIISGPWSDLSFRPDLEAGITNLLQDPEGAVDAVQGLIGAATEGGAAGAAAGALGAITGGAIQGGSNTGSVVDQVIGQTSGASKQTLLKAAQQELRDAKASGDKPRIKAARAEVKRIKAMPDDDPAAAAIGGLINGILKKN
jgi:AsmA protein